MLSLGDSEIYTFDGDFDRVTGVTRIDPKEEVS